MPPRLPWSSSSSSYSYNSCRYSSSSRISNTHTRIGNYSNRLNNWEIVRAVVGLEYWRQFSTERSSSSSSASASYTAKNKQNNGQRYTKYDNQHRNDRNDRNYRNIPSEHKQWEWDSKQSTSSHTNTSSASSASFTPSASDPVVPQFARLPSRTVTAPSLVKTGRKSSPLSRNLSRYRNRHIASNDRTRPNEDSTASTPSDPARENEQSSKPSLHPIKHSLHVVYGTIGTGFAVINKPAGLSVELSPYHDSVERRLRKDYQCERVYFPHRIDKHTSGLIVVAFNYTVFRLLNRSLEANRWVKKYRVVAMIPNSIPSVVSAVNIEANVPTPRNVADLVREKRKEIRKLNRASQDLSEHYELHSDQENDDNDEYDEDHLIDDPENEDRIELESNVKDIAESTTEIKGIQREIEEEELEDIPIELPLTRASPYTSPHIAGVLFTPDGLLQSGHLRSYHGRRPMPGDQSLDILPHWNNWLHSLDENGTFRHESTSMRSAFRRVHPYVPETMLFRSCLPNTVISDKHVPRPSHTEFKLISIAKENSLALYDVTLHTGRSHQIRVHFSESGLPIAFDPYYNHYHVIARLASDQVADNLPLPIDATKRQAVENVIKLHERSSPLWPTQKHLDLCPLLDEEPFAANILDTEWVSKTRNRKKMGQTPVQPDVNDEAVVSDEIGSKFRKPKQSLTERIDEDNEEISDEEGDDASAAELDTLEKEYKQSIQMSRKSSQGKSMPLDDERRLGRATLDFLHIQQSRSPSRSKSALGPSFHVIKPENVGVRSFQTVSFSNSIFINSHFPISYSALGLLHPFMSTLPIRLFATGAWKSNDSRNTFREEKSSKKLLRQPLPVHKGRQLSPRMARRQQQIEEEFLKRDRALNEWESVLEEYGVKSGEDLNKKVAREVALTAEQIHTEREAVLQKLAARKNPAKLGTSHPSNNNTSELTDDDEFVDQSLPPDHPSNFGRTLTSPHDNPDMNIEDALDGQEEREDEFAKYNQGIYDGADIDDRNHAFVSPRDASDSALVKNLVKEMRLRRAEKNEITAKIREVHKKHKEAWHTPDKAPISGAVGWWMHALNLREGVKVQKSVTEDFRHLTRAQAEEEEAKIREQWEFEQRVRGEREIGLGLQAYLIEFPDPNNPNHRVHVELPMPENWKRVFTNVDVHPNRKIPNQVKPRRKASVSRKKEP